MWQLLRISFLTQFILLCTSVCTAQGSCIKQYEKVSIDWQKTGKLYEIIFESAGDIGELRIKSSGHEDFNLVDSSGFSPVKISIHDSSLIKSNQINSKYFYMSPDLKSRQGIPALFVFGYPEASDPGSIHVIVLDSTGFPEEIFYSETFQVMDIKDIDNDSEAELIGKHTLSQLWGNRYGEACFSTYDPYSIYKMSTHGNAKLTYNLELSKKYNIDYYYGWAGEQCSEEIIIVLCTKDGKPLIMKKKEADRIYK